MNQALEGSILKLNIQVHFFKHFCPRLQVGTVIKINLAASDTTLTKEQ